MSAAERVEKPVGNDAYSAILQLVDTNQQLKCLSVELTEDGIEVVSAEDLQDQCKVELVLSSHRLLMSLASRKADDRSTRYRFALEGQRAIFQDVVSRLAGVQRGLDGIHSVSARRGTVNGVTARAKRVRSLGLVDVAVKTWGTRFEYRLSTEDLSRTGALLVSSGKEAVPFREGTLLEVRFTSTHLLKEGEIYCSAKVVRKSEVKDAERGLIYMLGIQLIELEGEVQQSWQRLLANFEAMENEKLAEAAA